MKTNDFMNANLEEIKDIIKKMPNDTFDSHEFIKIFVKKFEPQYVTLLALYKKNPHRIVNSQIALNLVKHMDYLEIEKNGKVISETVFGLNNRNELWNKK
jgi:glutathione peroxidase-family protein